MLDVRDLPQSYGKLGWTAKTLERKLNKLPGVVSNGVFAGQDKADMILVGKRNGEVE